MTKSICNVWAGIWITITLVCTKSIIGFELWGLPNQCKKLPGLYSRDKIFDLRCCKGHHLVEPLDLEFNSEDEWNCFSNVIQNNPDDDLVTSMWKSKVCKVKNLMGLADGTISYKVLVDFLTQNYTTENNLQSLIKDANTECSDGDKESEEHKRIQAYFNCFYKNEQKICEDTSANATARKESFIQANALPDLLDNNGCGPIPGIWEPKHFCCNGTQTPENYLSYVRDITSYYTDTESSFQCREAIFKFQADTELTNHTESLNTTLEGMTIESEEIFGHFCSYACSINPVIFSVGAVNKSINWDVESVLDKGFSNYTTKVKNALKAFVKEKKSTAKVPLSLTDLQKRTGVSFEAIETQYAMSDDSQKLKYYCSYYGELSMLSMEALDNYCSPNSS